VANKKTGEPFKDGAVGSYAMQVCQNNGLICRTVAGSSLALCPPLIVTEAQIDEIVEKMRVSLDQTLAYVSPSRR